MPETPTLTIGALAARTGLSVSAIRFYEEKGLVEPFRSGGNQRRFLRSDIRRLSFVLIAQQLGLSIGENREPAVQTASWPHPQRRRLAQNQQGDAEGDRRPDRGTGADARSSGRLYRLWVFEP